MRRSRVVLSRPGSDCRIRPAREAPGEHVQKLHLVGFTTDRDGLILATRKGAKSGGYVISLDDKLKASIDDARRGDSVTSSEPPSPSPTPSPTATPPPPPTVPTAVPAIRSPALPTRRTSAEGAKSAKPVSGLSPREIQARLRAGGTIADIAAAAGVDEEWVLRFAAPIRAEQARVVDRALRLVFVKPRLGPSVQPLGPSVQSNLSDKGIQFSEDVFDAGWTAYNLHGTTWAVRFAYHHRSRVHAAVWQVDLRQGEVVARGRLASELGYVEPGRKPARLESLEQPASPVARAGSAKAAKQPVRAAKPTARPVTKPARATAKSPAPKANPKSSGTTKASRPPAGPAQPERPTHLARPPSPMSAANRTPTLPGRLAGAPSLRPPPRPAPPRPRPAPAPTPASPKALVPAPPRNDSTNGATDDSSSSAGSDAKNGARNEAFTPAPVPAKPARSTHRPGRSAPARPVPTIPPMAVPSVIEVGSGDPEPAVVVRPRKSSSPVVAPVAQSRPAPEPPAVVTDKPKAKAGRRGRGR